MARRHRSLSIWSAMFVAAALVVGVATSLRACPFCSAVSLTFSEEIGTSDAVVVAKLVALPPKPKNQSTFAPAETGKAKFEIVKVLKGKKALADTKTIEVLFFGENPLGTTFLVMGVEPPKISWSTPIAISERGQKYVAGALDLPKEGVDRLAYFQDYLEDQDEMLARDAYDEFAKAPYATIQELKPHMHHDKLLGWVKDPKVHATRRRLYLTMLGAYGQKDDAPVLATLIQSKERQDKAALDALVAAYLTLKGAEGVKLVEDLFLKDPDADYTDTYATIMAMRFHGQEEKIIPKERLVEAMHKMLDRPKLADLVIADLARWEDWTAMDKLVDLFKNADEESSWVRVPVVNYLRACPLPKAKTYLAEVEKIDPDAVKRANSFFVLPAASGKTDKPDTKVPAGTGAETPKSQAAGKQTPAATPAVKPTSSPSVKPTSTPSVKPTTTRPPGKASGKTSSVSERAASLLASLAPGAALPADADGQSSNSATAARVLGAMAVSGIVLLGAFQGILRGGQRTAPRDDEKTSSSE